MMALFLLDPCLNRATQSENQINTAHSLMIFFMSVVYSAVYKKLKKNHFARTLKPTV